VCSTRKKNSDAFRFGWKKRTTMTLSLLLLADANSLHVGWSPHVSSRNAFAASRMTRTSDVPVVLKAAMTIVDSTEEDQPTVQRACSSEQHERDSISREKRRNRTEKEIPTKASVVTVLF
jgi:hypothetical protein